MPLGVETDKLFAGWHERPDHQRKLILLELEDQHLLEIHQRLLNATKDFPIFTGVEGDKYHPHITLAQVKPELADNIPMEIEHYIQNFNKKLQLTFNKAFFWGQNGPEAI